MYEVVIRTKAQERVIRTGIRRENGAINEREIAVQSAYANARKHADGDPNTYVVRGPIEGDANAEAVVYADLNPEHPAMVVTVVTYRRVPHTDDLLDALTASCYALGIGANL